MVTEKLSRKLSVLFQHLCRFQLPPNDTILIITQESLSIVEPQKYYLVDVDWCMTKEQQRAYIAFVKCNFPLHLLLKGPVSAEEQLIKQSPREE